MVLTVAALTFGASVGLILGSPASAAGTGAIEVRMPGQSSFATSAPEPLLNIADLVPGGIVTGTMQIRDVGDTDGTDGVTDALTLQMIDAPSGAVCDADSPCREAGEALADALDFTINVADTSTVDERVHATETVDSLRKGVTLATGLVAGDTVSMTLSAALPASTGNDVADGRLSFALQLALVPVASGGDGGANGRSGAIEVLDAQTFDAPPSGAVAPDMQERDGSEVLVLGRHGQTLSYTGTPTVVLISVGSLALLVGVGLLLVARRRA